VADDIFVGSVSVSVVPDLRGWNTKLRAELVPSAKLIGQEVGREIARGIMDELNIGKIITEQTAKAQVLTRRAGYELGQSYGRSFKRGFELALEGWRPNVTVNVDADTVAARAEIARLSGTVRERVRLTGGGGDGGGGGILGLLGGGGRGGGRRDAGGFIGGISSLLRALPGGTSGNIAAVPAAVGVPAAIAGAAALPFIAQMMAGFVPAVLGGGLAGLGIAGAFGAGQTPQAQVDKAKAAFDAAAARVVAAQDRLNRLRASGKASTDQLSRAEATLAGARASRMAAEQKYHDAERSRMTSGQEQVRAAFENFATDAKTSLGTIGLSFVPVMQSIFRTADSVLKRLTPVFKGAVDIIAGPFEMFSNTILKSFTSPQVASSIQAVAQAFTDVMEAFAPDIPGIVNSFADAIERIAHAVSDNPKAFADFLNFAFQVAIVMLNGIAFLTDFANYVEQHFMPAVQHFVNFWKDVWRDVAAAPGIALRFIRSLASRIWADIVGIFTSGRRQAGRAASGIGDMLTAPFRAVYRWMESWFKPWWRDNGEALKRIWRSTWFYVSTIVNGLVIKPVILAFKIMWVVIAETFRAGRQIVSALWRALWNSVVVVTRYVVGTIGSIFRIFWAALAGIFRIGAAVVKFIWTGMFDVLKAVARLAWAQIRFAFKFAWDAIVGIFTIFINLITFRWGAAFKAMRKLAVQEWNNIKQYLNSIWSAIRDLFASRLNAMRQLWISITNAIKTASATIWDAIWNGIVRRAANGARDLYRIFVNLRNTIIGWFRDTGRWLINAGANIITGLKNGIVGAVKGIGSWVKRIIVDPVVNAVKGFFGISSPSTVMMGIGGNLVQGLFRGLLHHSGNMGHFIKKVFGGFPDALAGLVQKGLVNIARLPKKAWDALGNVAGKVGGFFSRLFKGPAGGGVERWRGAVVQALAMLRLPIALAGRVLYQMQTESGGNPNAINRWDINAQRGDPSRGLMQTIGSTFAAYHVPGTSYNIYDPLANIAAAINYARHVYGPTLGALGSGHGYSAGGWVNEPVSGLGLYSGTPYTFAERGREYVIPEGSMSVRGGDGGATYVAHFDGLTGEAIESHVRTAFRVMSLQDGALNRPGRRSL
jgi:phage-related protein